MKLDNVASKQVFEHPNDHKYDKKLRNKAVADMAFAGITIAHMEDGTGFDYEKIIKIMHGDTSVSKEDYKKAFEFLNRFE